MSVSEAQQQLPELLAAAEAGEIVVIDGGQGRVFQLSAHVPAPAVNPEWAGYPNPGSAAGLIRIEDGFDEPLEELNEYAE